LWLFRLVLSIRCSWAFCVALLGWRSFALVPSRPTSTITKGSWTINPSASQPQPSPKTQTPPWPILD
jgi:hypothetical protein